MTTLAALARFVHDFDLDSLSGETVDRLELHLLDSLGAVAAGFELEETRAIRKIAGPDEVLVLVAAARATEMDDIHLASCTTPGSVVVGTALSLVAEGAITTPKALLSSLAVGYELTIRLGLAIDGPSVLGEGVWPTLFAAPLGSAAVASRALELSVAQTSGALATALALISGTAIGPRSALSSRWLSLGASARLGVLAARGAGVGLVGSSTLLERSGFRVAGVEIDSEPLLAELGARSRVDELCLKPYPVARQALAAVEACRELAASHGIEADGVDEIVVELPEAQRRVIDRPEVPETRFASIVSLPYLAALAIAAPAKLLDARRTPPYVDDDVRKLMARVRVEPDAALARHYPRAWPARASVRCGPARFEREILHPRGDVENEIGWEGAITKLVSTSADETDARDRRSLAARIRSLHEASALPSFELVARPVDPRA